MNKITRLLIILSCAGISFLMFTGWKFNRSHVNSGMISVVAGDKQSAALGIELKDYLPFDENSKIQYQKSEFQVTGDIPVLDGAVALYPVFSAITAATYPENSVHFDGENFEPESKLQMRNTRASYKAVVDGDSDIIFCAGPSKEQLSYAEENNIELEFIPIGYEAFVFIVNSSNPVNNLSVEQIKDIYAGKITNWKKVGGEKKLIAAWQRKAGSGSQSTFLKFMEETKTRTKPLGLFWGSPLGYSFRYYVEGLVQNEKVKMLALNGVFPTKENIRNGDYPLRSNFYAVYRKDNKNENIKKLVDWILSPEGQDIINSNGYVPLEKGTDPYINEKNAKETNMDAINIKNSDYRYDSFNNGKVLPFMEGKKKGLPAMGWNSWNAFGSANTEELTKIMADKFIELGLYKLGYKYIVLDDGCYKPARIDGKLSNEPVKFPSGFKALSDYVHSKGLKFGMYNDIGTNLCAGAAVGTCGHEDVDAASYVEWGVDFLKVDNCYYLWDNATFSNAENARYVYAPNIRSIRIEGKGLKDGIELSAAKNGKITGRGARLENNFVTNIGTFDGTGPENTPVGLQSGELEFEVKVPSSGEYKLYVEYATGREPGQGEWLQVAVSGQNELFFDGFLPATENKDTFTFSPDISITLTEGKNTIRLMNHRRQENTLSSYAKLLEEINKIKPDNDLVFSTCEWGKTQPQNWAYKVANSWRILNDITFAVGAPGNPGKANWVDGYTPSVTSQYNKAVIMDEFAGLNKGWNDPDMLVVGMDGLTPEMNRTHFAMWCMMNSPLMLGMDLRRVQKGDWMYSIITNEKLIALNQDILGVQAKRIKAVYKKGNGLAKVENPDVSYSRNNDRLDILAKPLYDGSIAVSFINLSQSETYENISVSMKDIIDAIGRKMPIRPDYVNAQKLVVENLWTGEKTEINWTSEDAATGIRLSSGSLKPCDNLTVRISLSEPMERRHVAASVHEYLLNTLHEADEENWDAAKELQDLYDCHVCVQHIAQVYVKGIMEASQENDELFGVRNLVSSKELFEIVNRVLIREK